MRDQTIINMEIVHPETTQLMRSLHWSGGRATPEGIVGAETYIYTSTNGWTVTIQYPVIVNPTFSINATYTSGNTSVNWQGTLPSGSITITETSYTFSP